MPFADIDECADSSLNPCGENTKCENNPGGYDCSCAPGFESTDLSKTKGKDITCEGGLLTRLPWLRTQYVFIRLSAKIKGHCQWGLCLILIKPKHVFDSLFAQAQNCSKSFRKKTSRVFLKEK